MAKVGMFMNLAPTDRDMIGRQNAFEKALKGSARTPGAMTFHHRHGGGKTVDYPAIAEKMVADDPAVLFATCWPTVYALNEALKKANKTIPIVYGGIIHPDGDSEIGPDGKPYYYGDHVTGFVSFEPDELCKCWADLLTQMAPKVTRVAILYNQNPKDTCAATQYNEVEGSTSLPKSKIDIRASDAQIQKDIAALKGDGGLIVTAGTLAAVRRDLIISAAIENNVPAIYPNSTYTDKTSTGNRGLMSYGPDLMDLYGKAAGYVTQILNNNIPPSKIRGTRSLEFAENHAFELVINSTTAGSLGLNASSPLTLNGKPIKARIVQ